ncbi:hypothetical protein CDAR_220901 [Caerostris darwini]|uniref:Uncharacterized protein n=1 Tax=Caerostris darwini TaxID=1538125 RepID=A0AAV4MVG5_9ARAC|nr:hypothetical protein CDAR_220901 [Caerostris darwini]
MLLTTSSQRGDRSSTNTRRTETSRFYRNERATQTFRPHKKSDGRIEDLAQITEEEYGLILRITEIGEKVAENSKQNWKEE